MKKLMAVAALAICASGCVMTRNDSIASALTLDVTSPDTNFIDNSVKPTKKGVAKATGLICFCEGDASIKAAMENGMNGFLSKPIVLAEVIRALQSIFKSQSGDGR